MFSGILKKQCHNATRDRKYEVQNHMTAEKSNKYTVFLIIILVIQVLLMFLNLSFALWGEYSHGYSSNIWSIIWNRGLIGLWTLLAGPVAIIAGIIGIATHKGNKTKRTLSIVTIASIVPGIFCIIYAIGSKF